jgi:hypothetical protein
MVGLTALWLPILLSAVGVFVMSSIIHMALRYHWSDYAKMAGEEAVMEKMRAEGVAPGNYFFPRAATQAEMNSDEMKKRYEGGPVGFMNILPSGPPAMGKNLVFWFIYTVVVGVLVAYVSGRTLAANTDYLQVFRVAGTVAFIAYAGASPIDSIWKGRTWSSTGKEMFDGLLYALVTAGFFGWLWPA